MNTTPLHTDTGNDFYAMLTPVLRSELSKYEKLVTVPAGTKLVSCGMPLDELVLINSGAVNFALPGVCDSAKLTASRDKKVFGMRAIISGKLAEEDVITQESCQVTLIPRSAFMEVLQVHPELYFVVAKILSDDLIMAQRLLKDSLRQPLRRKSSPPLAAVN